MDFSAHRTTITERARTSDLMEALPPDRRMSVLDVGARDGWFSTLLADKYDRVTALDLEVPEITDPRVECLQGDARNLQMHDGAYDLVFCAEVLEHIPPEDLRKACSELTRVADKYVLIGVPFKQDLRIGRTICNVCGRRNPPWGHVNSFTEEKIKGLFPRCVIRSVSLIGQNNECTNSVSTALLDFAGNPFGTYHQEEPCIYCGSKLEKPPKRNCIQRVATRLAFYIQNAQKLFHRPHARWIHVLLKK